MLVRFSCMASQIVKYPYCKKKVRMSFGVQNILQSVCENRTCPKAKVCDDRYDFVVVDEKKRSF